LFKLLNKNKKLLSITLVINYSLKNQIILIGDWGLGIGEWG